jgi:xylose isomerase
MKLSSYPLCTWGVHLNDQNGPRYDQNKAFGAENLRQAFNQVKVLVENGYGKSGEYIGLDVKAMRTQKQEDCYRHLYNSIKVVEMLEEKADRFDYGFQKKCIKNYKQNYCKLKCKREHYLNSPIIVWNLCQ